MNLFLLLLGLGPSLVWMYWIWRKDRFQREPAKMVLGLLIGGGLFAVVATLVVVGGIEPLVPTEKESPLFNMLFTAALPEELFKMLPVLIFAWRSPAWDEPFDGIVYAGATALGFNLIETIGYMMGAGSAMGSFYQALVRGTLGGHMVYGIIMGYFLSRAKFSAGNARWINLGLALAVPVSLHTAWNSALGYGGDIVEGNALMGVFAWGVSTVLWLAAFEFIRRNRDASWWNPEAQFKSASVQMAPTLCWHCQGPYPVQATFCHRCGAQVAPVAGGQQQQ